VLNLFTLDELIHVLPRRLLQPRTALVPVGYSLLIGGVARIDVLETTMDRMVLLTTFVSADLPLNCMPTDEVESFLEENLGTKALVVPSGGKDRLAQWPAMEGQDFKLKGNKNGGAVADIVLSSIGWVLLTSPSKVPHISIRSYTPGGRGLAIRSPMLPYAAELRGKRIPATRFYKSRDVNFLTNFTEPTSQAIPDSLLQLKLSELLRDARQFSMFRLYLQDTRGPLHELSFLAEASRIHDSMQRKTESSAQIAYDIWQLFGQFVHDSAPERIEFDEEIVTEFKAAVECNNLLLLDKIIEK
ncbi:hypothetical protein TELCIR_19809, partial [Teladorsagia circumcincta]